MWMASWSSSTSSSNSHLFKRACARGQCVQSLSKHPVGTPLPGCPPWKCGVFRTPEGSEGSAAGGRESDLSEWQRSVGEEGAPSPTRAPGTATGRVSLQFLSMNSSLNRDLKMVQKRRAFALLNLIPLASAAADSDDCPNSECHKKYNSKHNKSRKVFEYCCGHRGANQKTDNSKKQCCKNTRHKKCTSRSSASVARIT